MTAKQHPSERLQHGEARDFLHALDIDRQQIRYEWSLMRCPVPLDADERTIAAESLARIDAVERLYREEIAPQLRAVLAQGAERLRAAGFDTYARALETGDYSILAI